MYSNSRISVSGTARTERPTKSPCGSLGTLFAGRRSPAVRATELREGESSFRLEAHSVGDGDN